MPRPEEFALVVADTSRQKPSHCGAWLAPPGCSELVPPHNTAPTVARPHAPQRGTGALLGGVVALEENDYNKSCDDGEAEEDHQALSHRQEAGATRDVGG